MLLTALLTKEKFVLPFVDSCECQLVRMADILLLQFSLNKEENCENRRDVCAKFLWSDNTLMRICSHSLLLFNDKLPLHANQKTSLPLHISIRSAHTKKYRVQQTSIKKLFLFSLFCHHTCGEKCCVLKLYGLSIQPQNNKALST